MRFDLPDRPFQSQTAIHYLILESAFHFQGQLQAYFSPIPFVFPYLLYAFQKPSILFLFRDLPFFVQPLNSSRLVYSQFQSISRDPLFLLLASYPLLLLLHQFFFVLWPLAFQLRHPVYSLPSHE